MPPKNERGQSKRPGDRQFNFVTFEHPSAAKDADFRREVRSHVTTLQHRLKRQQRRGLGTWPSEDEEGGRPSRMRPLIPTQEVLSESAVSSSVKFEAEEKQSENSTDQKQYSRTSSASRKRRPRQSEYQQIFRIDLNSRKLAESSTIASKASRVALLDDPNESITGILGRLHLDFSSIMEHYHWIVGAQCPDFERQFMQGKPARYGFETLISGIPDDPALVATAILISAGHILSIRNAPMSHLVARCIYGLKSYVMNKINLALQDPKRATSDALIAAVLILASHEGLQGSVESFHVHMRGLVQMINLRGGLSALDDRQRYLSSFIVWQDTNVSAIMGCPPYHQMAKSSEEAPTVTPNPMMWLLKQV